MLAYIKDQLSQRLQKQVIMERDARVSYIAYADALWHSFDITAVAFLTVAATLLKLCRLMCCSLSLSLNCALRL
jgi:hypothetical protein